MRITLADLVDSEVTNYYSYRTARVVGEPETVSYGPGDDTDALSRELAKMTSNGAFVLPGNHVTYEVVLADGRTVCVQFSDWQAYFGSDVIVGRW